MTRVLVVAAHPDDEVLGAGGTMARHSRSGDRVTCLILGRGAMSRCRDEDERKAAVSVQNALSQAAQRAAETLGVDQLIQRDLPDNRYDSLDLLDVVQLVEDVVGKIQPDVVYTHFPGDLNVDHEVTARAVMTACRPLHRRPTRRLLGFEVPSSTGWCFPDRPFSPTTFVNIQDSLEAKCHAMEAYASELADFPHPRSIRSLRERAPYVGLAGRLDGG